MTAKRFTINMEDECIDDAKNEIFIDFNDRIDFNQLCELLNELHEENQDLKSFNKDLAEELSACANARISKDDWIEKLTEENEQLKKRIDRIDTILDDLNGAEYISRDDAIKALNKIDKVVR